MVALRDPGPGPGGGVRRGTNGVSPSGATALYIYIYIYILFFDRDFLGTPANICLFTICQHLLLLQRHH